jgi:hypothetical protein
MPSVSCQGGRPVPQQLQVQPTSHPLPPWNTKEVVFQSCTVTGKYAVVIPPLRGDAHGTRARDRPLWSQGSRHPRQPHGAPSPPLSLPTDSRASPCLGGGACCQRARPSRHEQLRALALHGRGIRETARVWQSSPTPGMQARQTPRRRCAVSTSVCWAGAIRLRGRGPDGGLQKRQGRQSGHGGGGTKPRAGCGLRSLPAVARSWPLGVGVARTPSVGSAKRAWSPWESRNMSRTLGALPRARERASRPRRGNATRRRARANL